MTDAALRLAMKADTPQLFDLINRSARSLLIKDYTADQVEGCLEDGFYGVDQQLIKDKTFFCVDQGGKIIACGGWSFRATLFGADGRSGRDSACLDPAKDAAKIRAFFVDPDVVGGGHGLTILRASEDAARKAGFKRSVLLGTLTGSRFYARNGYHSTGRETLTLSSGVGVDYINMEKQL